MSDWDFRPHTARALWTGIVLECVLNFYKLKFKGNE